MQRPGEHRHRARLQMRGAVVSVLTVLVQVLQTFGAWVARKGNMQLIK